MHCAHIVYVVLNKRDTGKIHVSSRTLVKDHTGSIKMKFDSLNF